MRPKRQLIRLVLALALAISAMTVTASGASAVSFNPASFEMKQTGTLTFTLAGGSPKTCAGVTISSQVANSSPWFSPGAFGQPVTIQCGDGSSYQLWYEGVAMSTSSIVITQQASVGLKSAYGGYVTSSSYYGTWTNGNSTTPSKLTFSNVLIGKLSSTKQEIRMSGTLAVTTASGGLVTLQ